MQVQYVHTIEVIDEKLKIFTKLDGQRLLNVSNPLETIKFTETTEVNLIDFRSRKTIEDYLGPDHAWKLTQTSKTYVLYDTYKFFI